MIFDFGIFVFIWDCCFLLVVVVVVVWPCEWWFVVIGFWWQRGDGGFLFSFSQVLSSGGVLVFGGRWLFIFSKV